MTAPISERSSPGQAVRRLGRFQLLRLLGKSARSSIWLVSDPQRNQDLVLVVPRQQPADDAAAAHWLDSARRAARVEHPGLQPAVEVGQQERWPYVAYERGNSSLLTERLTPQGVLAGDLVASMVPLVEGLAFAHEAGQAHRDLHTGMVQVSETGAYRLIGLGVAAAAPEAGNGPMALRLAAERDVLSLGLVLHHALAGHPALEQPDVVEAIARMPPLGREAVRLPKGDGQVIAEPLRAIVNRATDRQERQRYRSARTLARALTGWLRTTSDTNGGPMAMLLDRMRVVGLLPAMPGGQQRTRRLLAMDRERIDGLANIVIEDPALSFELLRAVNVGSQRVGASAGNGPILTVRRAIEMLGLDGVRRAASTLKPWPGPLSDTQAADLSHQLDLARRAGLVAQWVRPAGYDAELVYLLALLQRLGRLVVHYHFPDEAGQVRRLMQPVAPARKGDPEEPGMSEQGASFAVLGFDLDALGQAIGRHWGLDDSVLQMMRRLPQDIPVHGAEQDNEQLRMAASCANEVIDAQGEPTYRRNAALHHVAQRYARPLGVSWFEIEQAALGIAPEDREPPPHTGGLTRPAPL